MPQTNNNMPLSDALFGRFADFIYDDAGIRFQPNKAYFLSSKLSVRANSLGMDSLEEYYNFLQTPAARGQEHKEMIDAITINETFFFRNEPQLAAFEKDILVPLVQKRRQEGQNKVRFWSCAASTGDEPYTLALQLKSRETEFAGMQFEIVGTDICQQALRTATAGVYRQYAVRNIPHDLMQRYFHHDDSTKLYHLSDDIKRMVTLKHINLMDTASIRALGMFDIAICRNVLIYFDDKSKEQVLNNIYNVLKDDGKFVVGHSENIYSQRHIFQTDRENSASIAYVKAPPGTPKP